jgi:hypothetical protein
VKEIKTIEFVDAETQENAVAIIRAGNGIISLALSLEKNADIEVFLPTNVGRSLLVAIEGALEFAASSG